MTRPVDFYNEHGFYIIEGLLDGDECDRIHETGMKLIAGGDTPNRIMDPHHESDLFMNMLRDGRLVEWIEKFCGEQALGTQTMFYIKPPGSTGHGWHQDNYYITGAPKPVLAAWCALDRITGENGGLTVFPGSHRAGLLPMKPHNEAHFGNHETIVHPPAEYEPRLVEMNKGDVLFFDGLVIHGSYPNNSAADDRPAFIAHYLPSHSALKDSNGDRVPLHAAT